MVDEVGPLTGPRTMVVMVGLLFVTVTLTPGVVRSALSAPGATRHSRLSRQTQKRSLSFASFKIRLPQNECKHTSGTRPNTARALIA